MNPKITFAILVGVAFIDTYFFLKDVYSPHPFPNTTIIIEVGC